MPQSHYIHSFSKAEQKIALPSLVDMVTAQENNVLSGMVAEPPSQ